MCFYSKGQSISSIESVRSNRVAVVSLASHTRKKATERACPCAKHADSHAPCYAILVALGNDIIIEDNVRR